MKVIEENSERLVLAKTHPKAVIVSLFLLFAAGVIARMTLKLPPLLAGQHFWIVMSLIGFVLLYIFARSTRLTLDRHTGEFSFRRWDIFGLRTEMYDLGALGGARLQQGPGGPGGSVGLRVALVLKTPRGPRELPVMHEYRTDTLPDQLAQTINAWLARG